MFKNEMREMEQKKLLKRKTFKKYIFPFLFICSLLYISFDSYRDYKKNTMVKAELEALMLEMDELKETVRKVIFDVKKQYPKAVTIRSVLAMEVLATTNEEITFDNIIIPKGSIMQGEQIKEGIIYWSHYKTKESSFLPLTNKKTISFFEPKIVKLGKQLTLYIRK